MHVDVAVQQHWPAPHWSTPPHVHLTTCCAHDWLPQVTHRLPALPPVQAVPFVPAVTVLVGQLSGQLPDVLGVWLHAAVQLPAPPEFRV
jgi:hypothetical protein